MSRLQIRRSKLVTGTRYAGALASVLATWAAGTAAVAVQPSPHRAAPDHVNEQMSLRASVLQPVTLQHKTDGSIRAQVELDGVRRTVTLRRHTLRGERFRVLVQREPFGPLEPARPPAPHTYRGAVESLPGSLVSASIVNGAVTGVVRTADGLYGIQPVGRATGAIDPVEHVVFRAKDWIDREGVSCGTPDLAPADVQDVTSHGGAIAGTGLQVADVAIDADVEFFQKNEASVEATVRDIETVMDAAEAIYERDTGITYEITTIVVRTVEPDPYESSNNGTILCEFRNTWNDAPESNIQRDVAHLFTGKNIDGSVIGTAWLSAVCNATGTACGIGGQKSLAYGFSESRFTSAMTSRVALTAHELGHNWSALHCNGDEDCHIMCSGLGGCAGLAGDRLKFGTSSISSITGFRNTRACLADLSNPPTIPFFDDFPTSVIDSAKWSYVNGAVTTTAAVNPPSPPYALNIDRAGSEPYDDDEIRSNVLALGGSAEVALSYHTQHRGVPAGGALVVEYWNSFLAWQEVNRIVSDGVDESTFAFHSHLLPTDANHSEFRVRFRTEVSAPSEEWYIDDIGLAAGCLSNGECDDGLYCNGPETCFEGTCTSGTTPCPESEVCDEASRSCVNLACETPTASSAGGRYVLMPPPAAPAPAAMLIAPACDPTDRRYVGVPSGALNLATLVDSSAAPFLTPAEWNGVVLVTDESIRPGTEYITWSDCGSPGSPSLSAAGAVSTGRFGDVVGPFVAGAWTAPDGSADVATDVVALLEAFEGRPSAPPLAAADLVGANAGGIACAPDQSIDILDVTLALDAFAGASFSDATGCTSTGCEANEQTAVISR